MKRSVLGAAVALATGTASAFVAMSPAVAAPSHTVAVTATRGQAIAGHYIVSVRGASPRSVAAAVHATPRYVYDAVLDGFAAALNAGQLTALQHDPHVSRIEQDAVAHIDGGGTQPNPPSWGLDRIDQRTLPLNNTYTYNHDGSTSTAYIIDTGIYTSDGDFGGRAAAVFDAYGGNGIDCNGHGTHVAGTVGGAAFGVAKGVALRGVRVLDCSGSGPYSAVIAGMNWVANNHATKAVANMSLGGPYSADVNSAATALVNSGVFLAVAAGNSSADACGYSPSGASGVVAVAASDSSDTRASFSNYGSCVTVYAPGVNITSDWLYGGTNTISGTSMASPHVAGAAAIWKDINGDGPASQIATGIQLDGGQNLVSGNPSGTPNWLLYVEQTVPYATVTPPSSPSGPVQIWFSRRVGSVTSSNVVVRDTAGSMVPVSMACWDANGATTPCNLPYVKTIQLTGPFAAGHNYVAVVNPGYAPGTYVPGQVVDVSQYAIPTASAVFGF